MSIKTQLQRSVYALLSRDRMGSFATRADRRQILMSTAGELVALGYKIRTVQQLKQKHVAALSRHWQTKGLSNGTIKNRLSAIRHLAMLTNKADVVPSNRQLKVGSRSGIALYNKAVHDPNLSLVHNPYVRVSLELQRVFGLRREESIKIRPHMADKEDRLSLLGSWCKGNRSRDIPIQTKEQRYWLNEAKQLAGSYEASLIPGEKSYIRHRYIYDKELQRIGIRSHSLRHAYAQRRYQELTGWAAPIAGGPARGTLDAAQQRLDVIARMTLSEELGHSRVGILAAYCG